MFQRAYNGLKVERYSTKIHARRSAGIFPSEVYRPNRTTEWGLLFQQKYFVLIGAPFISLPFQIFDCFLRVRVNGSYNLGYYDPPGKPKFSAFLQIDFLDVPTPPTIRIDDIRWKDTGMPGSEKLL